MNAAVDSLPEDEEVDRLFFRRQFILSSEEDHLQSGGQRILIGGKYHLGAHRDLELTHVAQDGKSLTLLGFTLDPDRPGDDDEAILRRLVRLVGNRGILLAAIGALGGRWVLIVHDGAETIILHDATAQRQVYYTRHASAGSIVCASETGLLAERLGLNMDAEAVAFIQSRKTDDYEIYWMPGDTSLYSDTAALLPNHWLSLTDGACRRFWPLEAPPPVDPDAAFAECLRLLRGQMASARRRHPLALPMTAGWDSRLMLALSRECAADLHAFTLVYPHLPVKSRDVAVPARLLAKLGITHHVIQYPETIDRGFKEIFRRNNSSANSAYCADTQALHEAYPGERICVTGDAAEIVKCYYQRASSGPVSAEELADFSRLGRHPFALRAFAEWLDEAGDPPLDLLDLFCWEQMAGRWQSKVRAEYDMVQDSFSPLNNRRLLTIMLALDPACRRAPDFTFFHALIHALWPEVLSEPINPPEWVSLPRRVLNVLKKTGLPKLIPKSLERKIRNAIR